MTSQLHLHRTHIMRESKPGRQLPNAAQTNLHEKLGRGLDHSQRASSNGRKQDRVQGRVGLHTKGVSQRDGSATREQTRNETPASSAIMCRRFLIVSRRTLSRACVKPTVRYGCTCRGLFDQREAGIAHKPLDGPRWK